MSGASSAAHAVVCFGTRRPGSGRGGQRRGASSLRCAAARGSGRRHGGQGHRAVSRQPGGGGRRPQATCSGAAASPSARRSPDLQWSVLCVEA
ncbi:hypothetical protein ABZP36_024287 [Zizania latifolia]